MTIDIVMQNAWKAFLTFRKTTPKQRAALMKRIASLLENSGEELIYIAMRESNLPEARLKNERNRTVYQLTQYAEACEQGIWLDARIDHALPDRVPARPDIRKMNVGLGPVVVFGASNFPFAYSTAGGDTATALAAGCPVVVKAHPAHPDTSDFVAGLIQKAVEEEGLDQFLFQHVHGASFEVGKALVMHDHTKAVGFTGSFSGGKQLYDWAQQRKEPIPVFSEMGSINPVFILPEKLSLDSSWLAEQLAGSITLGVGQFCTNPGLIITTDGAGLDAFLNELAERISSIAPAKMLHSGICKAYRANKNQALVQAGVKVVSKSATDAKEDEGQPTIAMVSGDAFLSNPVLHQEVFGPYSLVVVCKDEMQMMKIAASIEGQLTCSVMATEKELSHELFSVLDLKCGRMILNGVPTGVEVCWSMQHGGPFPATTDSRFGSVGPDAIKRFVRPVSFQNYPDELLPDELKEANPLGVIRVVNGVIK